MELYELYAEKKDAYSDQAKDYKRIGIFRDRNNALEHKKWWEEKWQYNSKNGINGDRDVDVWIYGSTLTLKSVKTND